MKKLNLAVILTVLVLALAACGKKDNEGTSPTEAPTTAPTTAPTATPTAAPTNEPEPTAEPEVTEPEVTEPAGETAANSEEQAVLDEIMTAVKEAYGENYPRSMPYDATAMEEYFGVKPELYDAFAAEGPMISVQIDTFVAIHATEGNVQAVEEALNAYRDRQLNNTLQYPANALKLQASKVVTVDDYVFFMTLGYIDDTGLENEEQHIAAYAEQNEIAVGVIESILSK